MYAERLQRLLAPLGFYTLDAGASGAELMALGAAMDDLYRHFAALLGESVVATAETYGLTNWEGLLPFRPAARTTGERRAALQALLGLDWRSSTAAAVSGALRGCGTEAVAGETETPRTLELSFPTIKGVPKDIDRLRAVIEQILPSHLAVDYVFHYNDWNFILAHVATWNDVTAYTWEELETM